VTTIQKIVKDVKNLLEYKKLMGVKEVPMAKKQESRSQNSEFKSQKPAARKGSSKEQQLRELREEMGDCTRCRLGKSRTHLVFGVGNPDARLMFIGEAPGRDEDLQGEPFVGRAGQLLTKIIEAMGYKRSDVYITNILKSRPPENRNPEPDEIEICLPFLKRQIEIIKPRAIVCLGKFAAQTVLNTGAPISSLRGRMGEYEGIPVMPTYHPAYLLRNPDAKKQVWEDVQKVMKLLK
jgi:uracil-DNA glycosylase family 4